MMVSKTIIQEPYQSNPSISIVIPTYNSAKTLRVCLESIKDQDYTGHTEVIIADGGSTDSTHEIAGRYTDKIYPNPLKTGEAGKAAGVKHARGEIIALIDSDNILPERDWLARMIAPFADPEIAGTEPLYYTYREEEGYITRYCALEYNEKFMAIFLCSKVVNRYIMRIKAIYKNDMLKPLEKLNLKEGEEVEINIKSVSLANEFQGVLKLRDPEMIEEIAESDELI